MKDAFIVEDEKIIIGLVELVEIDLIHRNAEFQIIIDPNCQGKGYAYIVTTLAMKYAFNNLNLHKLYLLVDKQNEKAIHIYKKAGFNIEGELREEFLPVVLIEMLFVCAFSNLNSIIK